MYTRLIEFESYQYQIAVWLVKEFDAKPLKPVEYKIVIGDFKAAKIVNNKTRHISVEQQEKVKKYYEENLLQDDLKRGVTDGTKRFSTER